MAISQAPALSEATFSLIFSKEYATEILLAEPYGQVQVVRHSRCRNAL
jgi:hypothetical protein